MRSPHIPTKSSPLSPQLEKARELQRRPNAAKNKTEQDNGRSNRDTDVENKRMDTKGEGGGGMNWEIRIDIYTLLILCIK